MAAHKSSVIDKLEHIKDLPTLPQVILHFQEELQSRYCDATSITRVVSEDPAIVAKVLKVANSPLFKVSKEVVDVQKAIVSLGMYEVYNIVLAMSTINLFKKSKHVDYKKFWSHSMSVAFGTGILADHSGRGHKHLGDHVKMLAFTAGLLHDVGLLVLDQHFPELYEKVIETMSETEGKTIWEAEEEVLGGTHAEVGGVLLKKWGLPVGTIAGITHQLDPEKGGEHAQVCNLIQLSNHICDEHALDNGVKDAPGSNVDAVWKALHIPHNQMPEIEKSIKAEGTKSPVLMMMA